MTEAFDRVAHVAPTTIADDLAEMGAETIIDFPDLLTHGPVSTDPKRHRKVRLKYWRGLFERVVGEQAEAQVDEAMEVFEQGYVSSEQIGSAAAHAADGAQIVIWTTPTFEDRLFLWFCFHALLEEGVPSEQMATAEPRLALPPIGDEPPRYASLRSLEVGELSEGFDELFYPKLVYVEAGANLWETFSSGSPRQIAISIPHTTKFFPEFQVFAEDYGHLFPVVDGEHAERVELSKLDADLLGQLDTDASLETLEVLDEEIVERYAFLDELVLLGRLLDWAKVGDEEPYVEVEVDAEAQGIFEQYAFQITERGRALLDEGFEPGRKLPLFFVGDSRLYAGKKPWVRRIVGDNWWFERFDAS